jgi:exodeoxyribonuclease VII large subunit
MSRRGQSQWEFGELFPPEQMRRVLTISELTTLVRRLLEKELGDIWVTGEVTNLRVQASGHVYFSLKGTNAQLSCVCSGTRQSPTANSSRTVKRSWCKGR